MNARLLFSLLVISVALAFSARFRRVGIALSVIVAALLIWFNVSPTKTSHYIGATNPLTSSSSTGPVTAGLSPANVELVDLQLSGNGAPWQLQGKVRNVGSALITMFTLRVTRLDCPSDDAAPNDCTLNWQGEPTLHVRLAAGATQVIDEAVWSHDAVPRLKGVARVNFMMLAAQAATRP